MSMSSRARRMLQHQIRNKADAELNLIPMIDILSVMVSFLLVYSTECRGRAELQEHRDSAVDLASSARGRPWS
jgi:biopolymer transport protein ExbD